MSKTSFEEISENQSGIHFANTINENDSLNYFKFPYMYMGGGVAIGDINNDGLSDIFLTGNMTDNKLYLNQGSLQFDDISETAGIDGDQRWYTGVTMTDINTDGYLDIYLSVSGMKGDTENQLFVNNGDLTFTESAAEYGINDPTNSIQSTFFDYDKDGDIDLFVANYQAIPISQGNMYYHDKMQENKLEESGHLYRNEGNGKFVDATEAAGVKNFGLTLGLVSADFNDDGWVDLYLSNDFNVPDYFYLNNGDGTFKEVLKDATGHVSMFGMGIDASDFNNDGNLDMVQAEMSPEDYVRARVNMASMNPKRFEEGVTMGFHYQYMQNSLQLNNGTDKNGIPIMSEISRFTNMASTDWSWSTLFADLDNDGYKDIYITNGMKRDVNDNDVNSREQATTFKQAFNIEITDYPSEPISNYTFKNQNGYFFEKVGNEWGLDLKGFSNGMSYGDLDNDGDLDLVINNIDKPATLFKNKTTVSNHLRVALKGPKSNPLGLGAKVTLHAGEEIQFQELTLTRGFQSSVEPVLHFGLGNKNAIDKLVISWPDGSEQIFNNPILNDLLDVDYSDGENVAVVKEPTSQVFVDKTNVSGIDFVHTEDLYDDYLLEPLLPYRYSTIGPALAVADVNEDGLEDFYVGNAAGSESVLFIQNADSKFDEMKGPWFDDVAQEDTAAVFFDFDNDGDKDLYVVSGGSRIHDFTDRLYLNIDGNYVKALTALPKVAVAGQAIAVGDFDKDGLVDIFLGGRNTPGKYPYPATSLLLKNLGGKDKTLRFGNVTDDLAESFIDLGMVTSATWTDIDGDSWDDLVLAGEWMPITIFKNNKGKLINATQDFSLQETSGWWYAVKSVDIDNDGDLDLVAGNLGLNHKYKTSPESPFQVYSADFDENGSNDIVLSYQKGKKAVPLRGRECSSQQVPAISKRFKSYREFANADLEDIYGNQPLEDALHYHVDTFAHQWFENLDGNSFKAHQLPMRAQLSLVNTINVIDYNDDAFPDLLLAGNTYGFEAETPKSDSGLGLILAGSPNGFQTILPEESGLLFRDDVKVVSPIRLGQEKSGYLLGSNNSSLRLLEFDIGSVGSVKNTSF